MHDVVILANPYAGGGRARVRAEQAADVLQASGIDCRVELPASLEELQAILDRCSMSGPHILLACGGDGTVHHVLQAAMRGSHILGIIPAGTGNDAARSLGISPRHVEAWTQSLPDLIATRSTRRIDVVHISHNGAQRWAVGIVCAGFDSAVNERANGIRRLRGTARYVAALMGELRSFVTYDFHVVMDGSVRAGEALLVAVGNTPQYGGGMRMCPNAELDDGLLDITWVGSAPRRTILRVFPSIFAGTHVKHPLVSTYRAREVEISAPGAVMYVDGERIGDSPVTIRSIPRALEVLVPPQ